MMECPPSGPLLVSAACIRDDRGRVLLSQRRPSDSFPLHWEFPGGKVEPGETPEAALIREIREELGVLLVRPEPWCFVSHAYPSFHLIMLVFQCRSFTGELQPLQVHGFDWFEVDAIEALPFPEADLPLIRRLREEWEKTR